MMTTSTRQRIRSPNPLVPLRQVNGGYFAGLGKVSGKGDAFDGERKASDKLVISRNSKCGGASVIGSIEVSMVSSAFGAFGCGFGGWWWRRWFRRLAVVL